MSHLKFSIAFLLGSPEISGGTNVIFEHASHLTSFGHNVSIITEEKIQPHRYEWHPGATDLKWLTIEEAKSNSYDFVIATWWKSPFLLHNLKGQHYVYFVQSIESRFFPEEDPLNHNKRDVNTWSKYCESTYSCNIPVITEARWIQKYLSDNYNRNSYLVRNGIRKEYFREDGKTIARRKSDYLRVLIEGPIDVEFKNVKKSIEFCQKAEVDEIWLLTSSEISEYPGVDRVFSKVPILETPAIYRSCDVLVKLSYIEGMFGPPLEMFHCGGTAIVYDVTGHDEYIIHDKNSLVVATDNEDEVVRLLQNLKSTPIQLQKLQQGALKSASEWVDWLGAALEFEKALFDINLLQPTNRHYLKSWAVQAEEENVNRFTIRESNLFGNRESNRDKVNDSHNFIQVYCWAEKDGLEAGAFKWIYYQGSERLSTSIEVELTNCPFWIRIDPSVRIGVIEIFSISVTNTRSCEMVYQCREMEQFQELFVGGTLTQIHNLNRALYLSYGDDPQMIIPAITEGESGDTLLIDIQLCEMGISEFIQSNVLNTVDQNNRNSPAQLLKRLLTRTTQ